MTATPPSYDPAPASDALLAARRSCAPLDGFPGDLPQTLADAYAVQHRSIGQWQDRLVGFKVGGIPMSYRESYGGTWLAGPIFESSVQHIANDDRADVTVYDGGFAAYEAEYVFRVTGLHGLTAPVETLEDAMGYVEAVHIGAEIASSPMALINDLGPGAIISDFGNNAGMVVGPDIPLGALGDLAGIDVSVSIDGKPIGQGPAKPGEGGPLDALRFFLNHIHTHRDVLDPPDSLWLSSGAVTGVHGSHSGTSAGIRFGDHGSFTLDMVPRARATS